MTDLTPNNLSYLSDAEFNSLCPQGKDAPGREPMTLKSLEDHNKETLGWFEPTKLKFKVVNGIACPNCGAELFDTNAFQPLLSWPPQYRIHCESCDYQGTRY